MKKILFGATALLLMSACSNSNRSKLETLDMETVETVETMDVDTASQAEDAKIEQDPESQLTTPQDSSAQEEKDVETKNPATAKYDPMLDKYDSLIKKCWSMSKKGMDINDQELADVWMETGNLGVKLDKANKSLTPEQQSRLKKLNKDFKKFCQTQPA